MSFRQIFEKHESLQRRKAMSQLRLEAARTAFSVEEIFQKNPEICVFAAGSLGRLECGDTSDLDVFVTTTGNRVGKLREIETFAAILKVNQELAFPELSNDGQFLSVFSVTENESKVGSPVDDTENWFTTRMLLLLESNYLCNPAAYEQHKQAVLEFYLRDLAKQEEFRPVFLLNDILRYWRTLCLNYESARSNPTKSWKKRNLNLRFSRLLTVFGTILPLMLIENITTDKIRELSSFTPMERLVRGLDLLDNAENLEERFERLLDFYEHFLQVKERHNFDELGDEIRADLKQKADYVAEFVFEALNHKTVPQQIRRYLVI